MQVKEMISKVGFPPKSVEAELARLYEDHTDMVEVEWLTEVSVKRLLGLLLADGTQVQRAEDSEGEDEEDSAEASEGEVEAFAKSQRPPGKKRKIEEVRDSDEEAMKVD